MWIIVDDQSRVIDCGSGCDATDRVEVDQPEAFRAEHQHNWIYSEGKLKHDPVGEERDFQKENAMLKAQIGALTDRVEFYSDCIAELATVAYEGIEQA